MSKGKGAGSEIAIFTAGRQELWAVQYVNNLSNMINDFLWHRRGKEGGGDRDEA
jgi:hypothetical protein